MKYVLILVVYEVPILKSPFVALKDHNWRQAMQIEFDALLKNSTWKLIPRSVEDNVINTNLWSDTRVVRYVANRMRQVEGCDYTQTFSPVVKEIYQDNTNSSLIHRLEFQAN